MIQRFQKVSSKKLLEYDSTCCVRIDVLLHQKLYSNVPETDGNNYRASPYESLGPGFVGPREWLKQEHIHCEAIHRKIQGPKKKPTHVVNNAGVENHEEERNSIVSELYQRSGNK